MLHYILLDCITLCHEYHEDTGKCPRLGPGQKFCLTYMELIFYTMQVIAAICVEATNMHLSLLAKLQSPPLSPSIEIEVLFLAAKAGVQCPSPSPPIELLDNQER